MMLTIEKKAKISSVLAAGLEVLSCRRSDSREHLVLAKGYVSRLLRNVRIFGYLAQCHPEILAEFQKLSEARVAS
jgi:hypothetical protein